MGPALSKEGGDGACRSLVASKASWEGETARHLSLTEKEPAKRPERGSPAWQIHHSAPSGNRSSCLYQGPGTPSHILQWEATCPLLLSPSLAGSKDCQVSQTSQSPRDGALVSVEEEPLWPPQGPEWVAVARQTPDVMGTASAVRTGAGRRRGRGAGYPLSREARGWGRAWRPWGGGAQGKAFGMNLEARASAETQQGWSAHGGRIPPGLETTRPPQVGGQQGYWWHWGPCGCYHPQGDVPKSDPLSGWPGRGGHTAQEPRYTARWPQVLAVENRLTHPRQGFWKSDFLWSFSKTGPDKTHASSGDFSSGPVTACGHSPPTASADEPDLLLT